MATKKQSDTDLTLWQMRRVLENQRDGIRFTETQRLLKELNKKRKQ